MKVTYRLATNKLASVAAEAAWAENMGYDAMSSNETAHDSFLPLALAATSTNKTILETRVAIAFPRSPMITAYLATWPETCRSCPKDGSGWDWAHRSRGTSCAASPLSGRRPARG